ncbi:MAG: hypothetical protein ACYSVY_25575 [Planctomycetota bacterium]
MMKALKNAGVSLAAIALMWAASAHAGPVTLSAAQMDSVAAAGVETVDGFVCPVITTDAVLNSPNGGAIYGGDYTIIGPDVAVPVFATNDNGAGAPTGAHAQPGDTSYTAIWAK